MTETALAFHELSFVPEGDEVVVGRLDTGSYVVLPPDGAELLRQMVGGMTPTEAASWYADQFGEQVDVAGFVATLGELEFIRQSAGPTDAGAGVSDRESRPVGLQRLGRAMFSPIAWICYTAVVATWVALIAHWADLRPAPSQIFFTGSLIVVQLVITFGQVPLLFVHEGFHILAGRRLGLPSQLDMSNRLTYIVFETKLNGLLSVPRRRRYLPFLAGMVSDWVVLGGLAIIAETTRHGDGSFSLAGRVCLAFGFTVVMRMAWQFQLYLRTDLYFVFATALRCYDLHDASKALLWNRIWRRLGRDARIVDETQWTDHDRRVGTYYGPFLVLGVCTFVAITVFATAPVVFTYFHTAFQHLASGRVDREFWDSVASLAVNAGQLIALAWLARRKRRRASPGPRLVAETERALT